LRQVAIKKDKNNQVNKSNTIIEAKGALSETANKILANLIAMLRVDDTEFQKYAMNIQDYLNLIGSSSKNTEAIKTSAEELMRNPFWVGKKLFNWCSMVDIESMEGYIIFDIHGDLKPHLLELKNKFTSYEIINVLSLKGDYTPRLYEYFLMRFNEYKSIYFKQNNKMPKSFTFDLELEWLIEYLQIPTTYRYADIKRQILEVTKKQLLQKTNIKFDYDEKKFGRKVATLIVKVENNEKGSNDFLKDERSFINYMRKNFVNKDVLKAKSIEDDSIIMVSIAPDGTLYNKYSRVNINAKRSKVMWSRLYTMALENKLEILTK